MDRGSLRRFSQRLVSIGKVFGVAHRAWCGHLCPEPKLPVATLQNVGSIGDKSLAFVPQSLFNTRAELDKVLWRLFLSRLFKMWANVEKVLWRLFLRAAFTLWSGLGKVLRGLFLSRLFKLWAGLEKVVWGLFPQRLFKLWSGVEKVLWRFVPQSCIHTRYCL